jgi:hypothetical protein
MPFVRRMKRFIMANLLLYHKQYTLLPQDDWLAAHCLWDKAFGAFWQLCLVALFSLEGQTMLFVSRMKRFIMANLLSYRNHYIRNAPPPPLYP